MSHLIVVFVIYLVLICYTRRCPLDTNNKERYVIFITLYLEVFLPCFIKALANAVNSAKVIRQRSIKTVSKASQVLIDV